MNLKDKIFYTSLLKAAGWERILIHRIEHVVPFVVDLKGSFYYPYTEAHIIRIKGGSLSNSVSIDGTPFEVVWDESGNWSLKKESL